MGTPFNNALLLRPVKALSRLKIDDKNWSGFGITNLASLTAYVNFISNGCFFNDLSKWSTGGYNPPTISRVSSPTKIGSSSMQITAPAGSGHVDSWAGQWRADFAMYKGRTITFQAWLQCPVTNSNGGKCCIYDGTAEVDADNIPYDGEWHLSQVSMTISPVATSLLGFVRVENANDVVYVSNAQLLDNVIMAGDLVQHDGSVLVGIRAGSIGTNLIANDMGNLLGWGYPP